LEDRKLGASIKLIVKRCRKPSHRDLPIKEPRAEYALGVVASASRSPGGFGVSGDGEAVRIEGIKTKFWF